MLTTPRSYRYPECHERIVHGVGPLLKNIEEPDAKCAPIGTVPTMTNDPPLTHGPAFPVIP